MSYSYHIPPVIQEEFLNFFHISYPNASCRLVLASANPTITLPLLLSAWA